MKIFTLIPLIVFLALSNYANAAFVGTPFSPEEDARFNALEASTTTSNDGTDGLKAKHTARATWNAATQGTTGNAYSLGVTLPAKAVIQRSYFLSDIQPVSAGAGTVAFSCTAAGDIFAAATITSKTIGTFTEGVSTGTAATMKLGTTACAITATIASASYSAGKQVIFVDYNVDN